MGTELGKLGVNIGTFALGRRTAGGGGEALALVGLDGNVDASIVQHIRALPSVTDVRLVRLPAAPQATAAPR
jgi:D-3-phosphoglycerate dehydrogenase / 2-oxoglutarate reductase